LSTLIATCAYEAARPHLSAWIDGAVAAGQGRNDIGALVVVDRLQSPAAAFARLSDAMNVQFIDPPALISIAGARELMLKAAYASSASVIAFCDADDVLMATALEQHDRVLVSSDISVGDLMPVDLNGQPLEACLFGDELPNTITAGDLAEVNFCGFSNTAVRRDALSSIVRDSLPELTAVDWWVFTRLVGSGARARGDHGVVVKYRQHADNILSGFAATTLETAQRRLRIAADHYRALGTSSSVIRANAAQALADDVRLGSILAEDRYPSRAWFSDVARWLDHGERISGHRQNWSCV
jgi:hypothetical protein